jgi:hypothetical protein
MFDTLAQSGWHPTGLAIEAWNCQYTNGKGEVDHIKEMGYCRESSYDATCLAIRKMSDNFESATINENTNTENRVVNEVPRNLEIPRRSA